MIIVFCFLESNFVGINTIFILVYLNQPTSSKKEIRKLTTG